MRPDFRAAPLAPDDLLQFRTTRAPGPRGLFDDGDAATRARPPRGPGVPGPLFTGPGADAAAKGGVPSTQAARVYKLPDAETNWTSNLARIPQVSKLPLYLKDGQKDKPPKYDQVLQQGIANCYLAATLAALANTSAGVKQIQAMIVEHTGPITTICKRYEEAKPEPEQRLKSNRWFTVAFKKSSVDVSDVLYHDDSDRDPNLRYMTTPGQDRALWGGIIEVAYARLKNGYDNIGAGTGAGSLNQFFDEFSNVAWTIIAPSDDGDIKKACASANTRATLIATKSSGTTTLTAWHGYAVVGMSGGKVKLWDPLDGKTREIGFAEMIKEIQAAATVRG